MNVGTLDRFLIAVEEGYQKNGNPYHNECHATDVTHTVFYFLSVIGLAVSDSCITYYHVSRQWPRAQCLVFTGQ